jgi:hypothetical protein
VKFLKYVPFIVVLVVMEVFAPDHDPSKPTCPTIVLVSAGLMSVGIFRIVYLLSQRVRLAIILALLPADVLLTYMSHLRYGDWSFEFNPWVGAYGSLWPIVIFSALLLVTILPYVGTRLGGVFTYMFCIVRIAAVLSHPLFWISEYRT